MRLYRFITLISAWLFLIAGTDAQTVSDYDGNTYPVITVGTQVWMGENLRSLHYPDGTGITYTWKYNDSDSLEDIYGHLYSWESAMRGAASSNGIPSGVQGACPAGWHLPSVAEWMILIDFCGGEFEAGAKLKEADTTHWNPPNEGANNATGFTALPGGSREKSGYGLMGATGFWWTSHVESGYIYAVLMGSEVPYAISLGTFFQPEDINETGYSVRCLKNANATQVSNANKDELFNIYPDPSNEWINIRFEKDIDLDLSIFGPDGKLMLQKHLNQQESIINIENLPEGIYIVSLKSPDGIMQHKIMKVSN